MSAVDDQLLPSERIIACCAPRPTWPSASHGRVVFRDARRGGTECVALDLG